MRRARDHMLVAAVAVSAAAFGVSGAGSITGVTAPPSVEVATGGDAYISYDGWLFAEGPRGVPLTP